MQDLEDPNKMESDADDPVDISLIRAHLRLSYEERIEKHEKALRFFQELRLAGRSTQDLMCDALHL